MRYGVIKVPPSVITCPAPVCPACQYGKAHRRIHTSDVGKIDGKHHRPGDGVSADQLKAGHPGIIPTNKGSPTTSAYHYCNFWVDYYSHFMYVTMHTKKDAKEMLQSKQEFEAFCAKYNVNVKQSEPTTAFTLPNPSGLHAIYTARNLPYVPSAAIGKMALPNEPLG
jgi:hypothetical protein